MTEASGRAPLPADGDPAPATADAPEHRRWASFRRRIRRSEEQLEARYDEAKARRGESAPIDVAFRVIEADRRYAGGLIAGGMAFRVFVVLIPFSFVVVTAFGYVAEAVDSDSPQSVARELGMTGLVASTIDASIGSSTWERLVTLVLALYALFWATWTLMRAMQAVYGLAWDVEPRTSIKSSWRPLLWLVAILLALFLGGVAVSVLIEQAGLLGEILIRILMFGAVVALWVLVSWLLPRAPETTWRSLLPGAVVLGVGVLILQFLTVAFFSRYIEDKTETYGAIGASLAILLWAYLLGRLVVTSAFLNAARWRQGQEGARPVTGTTAG